MPQSSEPYDYVLYIDEAGDDVLARVQPVDANDASEWLVMGGFLTRSSHEGEVDDWVRDLRDFYQRQARTCASLQKFQPSEKRRCL